MHSAATAVSSAGQDALQQVQSHWILESITDGFFALDAGWRFQYVNGAAERFLRKAKSELLHQSIWEVFPEAIGTRFQSEYELAMRERQARHFEEHYPPLNGWFEVHAYPSADGLAVCFRDITERKRTHDALLRAKLDWERTFDSVPDLIAILDTQHRIVRANRAMIRRLGLTSQQCLGQLCYHCVHGQDRPPEFCPHTLTLKDAKEHVVEVHEEHMGGDFLVSTTPLLDEQGRVIGSVHVARDITERKRAERALREAKDQLDRVNDDLERRVQERTAELRETIGDLEQFSYSIAHDLRAPLRSMASFATLLLEEHASRLEPEALDYLQRIGSAAKRMDELIRDVLTYSQVLRSESALVTVDLHALVHEIVAQYPHLHPDQADIQIIQPLASVEGNLALVTQCVSNLLGNAVKFVAPGTKPQVRIWSEEREGWVRVCVSDQGIGVEADQLDRIWRIFERAHSQDDYPGTGIGLSVVKRAVERMGGTVGVQSAPGKGSTFWFELPKVKCPDEGPVH